MKGPFCACGRTNRTFMDGGDKQPTVVLQGMKGALLRQCAQKGPFMQGRGGGQSGGGMAGAGVGVPPSASASSISSRLIPSR